MNAIPPENIALLVGCFTMFISGIWLAFKFKRENAPQPAQITKTHQEIIQTQPQDPTQNSSREKIKVITQYGEIADIDPRDLRTLRELGFQPRREREEKREEPEPKQQQASIPSRDVYLCLECGRRIEYIEQAKIYKPGVGLIAIPRCPFCGAPIGPSKVVEKEEAELPSLRAIEPPRFPEKKPRGLGIERPTLEEEAEEAEGDEEG